MKEQLIVTLTTWKPRIGNIPAVLDSIYAQTLPPDKVVLNLAYDEVVPSEVQAYLDVHGVEVNRVEDTKVFKKLIPTLKKYPDACVVPIDDDWIYPDNMLEEFMEIHRKCPWRPISGNRVHAFHTDFHCGCASLTKRAFFGKWLDRIDHEVMRDCQSDDTVYTYFQKKNGFRYIHTRSLFYENMIPYQAADPFSAPDSVTPLVSWYYLCGKHGRPNRRWLLFLWRGIQGRFLHLLGKI